MTQAICDYTAAGQAATALLLRQRLHTLRFQIQSLHYEQAIRFDTMQNYCALTRATMDSLRRDGDMRDAVTLRVARDGKVRYYVLCNQEASHSLRKRFTLAHEVGHICLDHADDSPAREREANAFAAQLLLPQILVEHYVRLNRGRVTAAELSAVFGVSRDVAENRLRSMRRPAPYTPDDEALLFKLRSLLPCTDGPLVTI